MRSERTPSVDPEVSKAMVDVREALRVRHRKWTERKSCTDFCSWRPQIRQRVAARHWCLNVDNSIRNSLGFDGLRAFQIDVDPEGAPLGFLADLASPSGGDGPGI